jgi:TPR repeat protein
VRLHHALAAFALHSHLPGFAGWHRAQTQPAVVGDCDRLAGSPDDPGRVGLGVRFEEVEGPTAVVACRAAIESDPDQARLHYQLGRAYDVQDQFAEAYKAYAAAAAKGYAPALNALGSLHEHGLGVAKDEARAAALYQQAVDAGFAFAAVNKGLLYLDGRSIPKDPVRAAELFRPLADSGDALAQVNLGYMYERGQGVAQDDKAAVDLYRKAAEQGEALGQNNLAAMLSKGRGVGQDNAEAIRLYRLAVAQGNHLAERNLGEAYQYGRGVPGDPAEAERWYRKAIEGGDVEALNSLAWMWAQAGEKMEDAEALVTRAVAETPDTDAVKANYLDTLAWVRFRQERLEEALRDVQVAIALNPGDSVFHAHLGDILAALGRKEEARARWQIQGGRARHAGVPAGRGERLMISSTDTSDSADSELYQNILSASLCDAPRLSTWIVASGAVVAPHQWAG